MRSDLPRLRTPRKVSDFLYGQVYLTEEEMALIDHRLVQRQRRTHQDGMVFLVWPSAEHTRFGHGIGAVYALQCMFDALYAKSCASSLKLYGLEDAEPGQAIRFHDLDDDVLQMILRVARIAVLNHDIGHGPFSHQFDVFAPRSKHVAQFLGDHRLAALEPFRERLLESKNGNIGHEAVSCLLFAMMWHEVGGESWMPAVFASILLGVNPPLLVPSTLRPWIPLIRDMVSSAPIDADRLDYLPRDSRFLRVPYGEIDRDRILESILCMRALDGIGYRLAWRTSGLLSITQVIEGRFHMFVQVYGHKTWRAAELMFAAIAVEARRIDCNLIDATTLDAFCEGYLALSDEMFLRTLMGQVRPGFPASELIQRLAHRIFDRRLWKRVYDFNREEAVDLADWLTGEMVKKFPDSRFILDRLPIRATKDLDRGAMLLGLDQRKRYSMDGNGRSWLDASPTIRALHEQERAITRLYLETGDDESHCPEAIRLTALELAQHHRQNGVPK